MRVLHLGKFFPPHPGGIERFCFELALAQRALGISPSLLVHARSASHLQGGDAVARRHGLEVSFVRSFGSVLFVPLSPGWSTEFAKALTRYRPDLLHIHLPNPSAFRLLRSTAASRLPWVLHWHADIPTDTGHRALRLAYPAYRRFERRMLAASTAVIATSQRYAAASAPLAAVADRLRVVPLGLGGATTPGAAPIWPGPGLRVLAVGRLSYYKGFGHLIDAVAAVPGSSLLLIGDGEERTRLRRRAEAGGAAGRIRFAGAVDDPTLEAAYRDCDLLCLPSLDRAEAFGLVLLEAMRAGKPVVAADIPGSGVGEVVQDRTTGLLVAPGDAPALAEAIGLLDRDPALRETLGAAGRRRWETHFHIGPVAAQISAIYRELLPPATAGS